MLPGRSLGVNINSGIQVHPVSSRTKSASWIPLLFTIYLTNLLLGVMLVVVREASELTTSVYKAGVFPTLVSIAFSSIAFYELNSSTVKILLSC